MVYRTIFFLFVFFPLFCGATDLKPWFGNDHEVELRVTCMQQKYHQVAVPYSHSFQRSENDGFLTLSAEYPFGRYCGEFEATGALTRYQKRGWDNFRITGRYQWLTELEEDAFTLTTGLTLTEPYSRALHDISSFHHGHIEGEAHLAFGKKYGYPLTNAYTFRWWNVLGFGISDIGSPWVRGDAACEYNYEDAHQFRAFINTLWGMGKNNIRQHHFKGYGKIKHKSVDLGIRYGYTIDCYGTFSIQYARRVFAYNFPENTNQFSVEYYLPFGTQFTSDY